MAKSKPRVIKVKVVGASPDLAVPSPSSKNKEDDYRAEDDHRQLMRVEEIRSDPSRMAGVKRHHQKQVRSIARMHRMLGARSR